MPRKLPLILLVLVGLLTACQPSYQDLRLTIATGGKQGVYYVLGGALADGWAAELTMPRPAVRDTAGSVANLRMLRQGEVDVGFSAADAAADALADNSGRQLRALARMHDDYIQIMVRAGSPVRRLADLRGLRVSTGSSGSGVELMALRLLAASGLTFTDLDAKHLGIDDSVAALRDGGIDAFFWSGGLPTGGITGLARELPLRMIDLSDVITPLHTMYPVYGAATIPASSYRLAEGPITTIVVPNFLLATDAMPDNVAEALTRALFASQPRLITANPAARAIDLRSAIETSPIPLHPGATTYYRTEKL